MIECVNAPEEHSVIEHSAFMVYSRSYYSSSNTRLCTTEQNHSQTETKDCDQRLRNDSLHALGRGREQTEEGKQRPQRV